MGSFRPVLDLLGILNSAHRSDNSVLVRLAPLACYIM
jgi:hypothetical protein